MSRIFGLIEIKKDNCWQDLHTNDIDVKLLAAFVSNNFYVKLMGLEILDLKYRCISQGVVSRV